MTAEKKQPTNKQTRSGN